MTQYEIEKAWRLMSMHNSELLLEVAELKAQLQIEQSIWNILKSRVRNFFRRKK